MITKNDLKVIKECLAASGVKNSEFQESTGANKDAYIVFVYNNLNYKIKVSNLIPIKNISLDGIKLIPDDNGNLNIELPKSKWDVITVNYYGNTPPPPQALEGTLCYNKSEKTLWVYRRPGGWRQAPWEENFYYIKGLNILCLYIPELGLLEIPKDKLDKLVSGLNIKTINGQSILGLGDLTINESGTSVTPSVLLPIVGTVVTTENNTNTTEVLNVGEDKSVYYDYRLEKFVVKTLQNVYYTQWEGDYSTSELYESISFVYTEYPETTIYKIDKTRPDTLLPISDCSVIEIVEWTNNAEDYPLGYDYPEGSYAISEDYLYRLIDGNWTLVGNTIDSTSPYNKRYYLIYQNALYTYKSTDGITPVIVPVSQDTIDAAIAPINLLLVTINNKLEQDEEDILDLKLITNILLGQKQSPLLVTIVTTNRGIAERTYTGTEGELCYIDSILYRGFAWRVGNTYYSNWTNVKPLPANLVGIDIIFEEKEGILYFYKITESGLELLSMLDVATRNYKELLPIEQIVDGLIIVSQDAPISGGIVIYNPTRKRFYYKDANSLTYHSVWSDDLGVPSYDDYLNADFVYIIDSYLQIYKVTPSGLVGINTINSSELQEEISNTIKNRLCIVIAYEGEDSQEKAGPWKVGEIWYDTINCQFFVCTHEGAIPETEITIPDSCLLYVEQPNGRFYYYNSALDAEPIPLLTVDSALNRNSTNPVENRAITNSLLEINNRIDSLNGEGMQILPIDDIMPSGYSYEIQETIGDILSGEPLDPTPITYTGEGGLLTLDPGSVLTTPRIVLAVEETYTNIDDIEITEIRYYAKWTGEDSHYSSEVYDISKSNILLYWREGSIIHIGRPGGTGNIIEVGNLNIDAALDANSQNPVTNHAITNALGNIVESINNIRNSINTNIATINTRVSDIESKSALAGEIFLHVDADSTSNDIGATSGLVLPDVYEGEDGLIVLNREVPRCELWVENTLNTYDVYTRWTETENRKGSSNYDLNKCLLWTVRTETIDGVDTPSINIIKCLGSNLIAEIPRIDSYEAKLQSLEGRIAALEGSSY